MLPGDSPPPPNVTEERHEGRLNVKYHRAGLLIVFVFIWGGCSEFPPQDESRKSDGRKEEHKAEDSGFRVVTANPAEGSLKAVLKQESEQAEKQGLKPFVKMTADWCPPCKAIERAMKDRRMVAAFQGTYIIKVDVDDWKKVHAREAGVGVAGIPTYLELDKNGRPTGRRIDARSFNANSVADMAPVLKKFFAGS